MKFIITYLNEIIAWFYKTALCLAVLKENVEIIKLLLTNDKVDVNIGFILTTFLIKFKFMNFYKI